MLFRPAESSKRIVEFYRNYLLTTFQTNNESYNQQLKDHLSKDGAIAKGPYISLSDSFTKGKTLHDLIDEGILSEQLLLFSELHPERKLYKHQVEAIQKATSNKNLIVTTGTGSGKTESFLIPVLNQLLREKEAGTLDPGVRTLIIYPMNALVNDQIRRLREIFIASQEEGITYGRFTGETSEKFKDARKEFLEREGIEPIKNELISREQMRETPPNILITNYAMLEYLLLRPGDNILFDQNGAFKWQTIVFDEAHTYGGAKGIEVSALIKRLKATLVRDDIQFILTSATLGDEKENPKIIKFAESLCSASFDQSSIVRAHTTAPKSDGTVTPLDFQIYRDLAVKIRNNYDHKKVIEYLKNQSIEIIKDLDDEKCIEKTLYQMILRDTFYHTFRNNLLNQTKQLSELSSELNMREEDITDFIAVAANAQKNGDKIFEARYHMFIRGLEGVFVTLKPSNKLFINKMETYKENPFDDDIGYKVFEISFCHNCNAIYITGQMVNGELIQRSKFNDDYSPDVFLLEGEYDAEENEESEEESNGESFILCSKCGTIERATSLEGLNCGHDSKNFNKLIRVKKQDKPLHACPCCHVVNTQRSIVRPYYLGNEAATAVISTALYNELPNVKIKTTTKVVNNYFFGDSSEETLEEHENLVKQFLVFSDNRQSAAFFATYLEQTYRNNLMKRLMTQVFQTRVTETLASIPLEKFVRHLEELFTSRKIYENEDRHKEAWLAVLQEMINYKAKNSLQNTGVLYFDLDIQLPANAMLGLTSDETTELFKLFYLYFIKEGAVKYPVPLTPADLQRLTYSGYTKGFDLTKTSKKLIESWLPRAGKDNLRSTLLKKLFPQMDEGTLIQLLESIWGFLRQNKYIVFENDRYLLDTTYIRAKRVEKLYKCDECKTVTPFNLKNICPNHRCNGHLKEYNHIVELKNNHYYKIFNELVTDEMIVKEHTAQLGSNKAYDYQREFKNKKLNVLSCSTTFEMGVDVGTLDTVFMRNMPPSPANYAQRAGRAGRSAKSAAYSITYCPNNSHDLNYFKEPISMIKGTIQAPSLNLNNEKIMQRHIFASAIAFFWKQHGSYYRRNIGEFLDADGYNALKTYLDSHPIGLKKYLSRIVTDREQYKLFDIDGFGWVQRLYSEDSQNTGVFLIAMNKYKMDLEQLEEARKEILSGLSEQENSKNDTTSSFRLMSIAKSLKTIKDQNIIEFLSRNNIIPKYGFPVDTVELMSMNTGGNHSDLRLDRDLNTAISEYAPESEVVADGMLITSRYVRVLNGYAWPKYNYVTCDYCKTLNRTLWTESKLEECQQCGTKLPQRKRQYIVPKFGFIMDQAGPKEVGTNKPERTYKGSISYIGDESSISFEQYNVCDKTILVGSSRMDELAVLNTSNFYLCETCGYGILKDDKFFNPIVEHKHKKPDGYNCSSQQLVPFSLGHEFKTDVVLIKFISENIDQVDQAWTILYSLLEGLSRYLSIDRNEISGCLQWYTNEYHGNGNFAFVLFDNTPGGAGYVRELRDSQAFIEMLRLGQKVVTQCTCGADEADTACYSCLCNYYNQKQHDLLKRKYAINFYQSLLNGQGEWTVSVGNLDDFSGAAGNNRKIAYFNEDGQNQKAMDFEAIWNYLAQDTNDEDELGIIDVLKTKTIEDAHYSKPYYGSSITVVDNKSIVRSDLLWPEKKVALFLQDSKEDYEEGKETDWNCYCLDEEFNVEEFLCLIKG